MKRIATAALIITTIYSCSIEYCWGHGIVGWGNNNYDAAIPPAGITTAIAVAAGDNCSLALKSNGTVVSWGDDLYNLHTPPSNLSGVTAIDVEMYHGIALMQDGTVTAWGANNYGQTLVPADLSGVIAVSVGACHSLALKSDGNVVGWGRNNEFQAQPPTGLSGVVAIDAGYYCSLAIKEDGTIVAWGIGEETKVPAGLSDVVAVSAGMSHALALKRDGTVIGWGDNAYGKATPPAGLSNVIAISAGAEHSLALRSDGTVVAWGRNNYNQCDVPQRLSNVTAISAGYDHSLAVADVPNTIPVADAGPDLIVGQPSQTTSFTLDGSRSSDPDGDTLAFVWKDSQGNIVGHGPTLVLSRAIGTYTFVLTVSDPYGATLSDSVTVVVQDAIPPVIAGVTVAPALAACGDPIQVTASVMDNVAVTSVTANGILLQYAGCSRWTGVIPASDELGQHAISLIASDGINVTTNTTGKYTSARLCGITGKSIRDEIISQACKNTVFKVWGRVSVINQSVFKLDDGSGTPVIVMANGYTGIKDGDYAFARGTLSTNSPTLTSSASLVNK